MFKDRRYKVRIFLNSRMPNFRERPREVEEEDFQQFAESRVLVGQASDVVWMHQQLFNVLAQKTEGNAWVLQCHRGNSSNISQHPLERLHDIKRVTLYPEMFTRKEMSGESVKEHENDTGIEMADITITSCLR